MRCDKITFFARTKELFSKKLLYFSVKSVILYPTGASVGYKVKRRAFLSGTPVVHPSIIMLFSSFTFLSFTLPAPQGARKAMTQPARVTAFSFCLCYRRPNHLNALRFTLGIFSGKLFFIANKPALRSWLVCFFTEKVASCAESGRVGQAS